MLAHGFFHETFQGTPPEIGQDGEATVALNKAEYYSMCLMLGLNCINKQNLSDFSCHVTTQAKQVLIFERLQFQANISCS